MAPSSAVEMTDCTVCLGGRPIFEEVSLQVGSGEVVGIQGDNGSGKSTMLRVMGGLIRPNEGDALTFGRNPRDPAVRRQIGAAIDTPSLYGWMSGIGCLRTLMDMSGEPDDGRSATALEQFGLSGVGRKRVMRYSQGMKKRLALAAASLRDPELVLVDEPTNALDPSGRALVYDWIGSVRDRGRSMVVVSHRSEDMEVCDRVFHLLDGRLREVDAS